MATTLSIDEPFYYKANHQTVTPGVQGSVGEVNLSTRYRSSAPDMPLRYDPYNSLKRSVTSGSNVQDGQSLSFDSGGGPARTLDSNFRVGGRLRYIRHGWTVQDLRAPDTEHQPLNVGIPQHSWNNRVAAAYSMKRSGDMFLPLPGAYFLHPSQMPRGGSLPRVVATAGDTQPLSEESSREGLLSLPPQRFTFPTTLPVQ